MNSLNDIALIAKAIAFNDAQAYGRLVEKYQSAIRRFFLHQTNGNHFLSDDLAQETFIKAYQKLSSFKSLSNFSTWLHRIAYNVFYDYQRSLKYTESLESKEVATKSEEISNDIEEDLYKALATLNESERICITLFYMEDMSIKTIEEVTQIPSNTVKSHLSRAKKHLQTWLQQNGYSD